VKSRLLTAAIAHCDEISGSNEKKWRSSLPGTVMISRVICSRAMQSRVSFRQDRQFVVGPHRDDIQISGKANLRPRLQFPGVNNEPLLSRLKD